MPMPVVFISSAMAVSTIMIPVIMFIFTVVVPVIMMLLLPLLMLWMSRVLIITFFVAFSYRRLVIVASVIIILGSVPVVISPWLTFIYYHFMYSV